MDADDWDRFFARRERVLARDPNPIVTELLAPLAPGTAIELGAGEGRNALWLARRGWRVTALDFSGIALERTRRQADAEGLRINCVLGDAREVSVHEGRFDLVLIAYMQPAAAQRRAMFAGAAGAVAPGGHLLVVGLDVSDPAAQPQDDDWRLTPERLADAFPGIELTRCERVTREQRGAHGTQQAIDSVAWGRRPATG